jgi:hypothetical protein
VSVVAHDYDYDYDYEDEDEDEDEKEHEVTAASTPKRSGKSRQGIPVLVR